MRPSHRQLNVLSGIVCFLTLISIFFPSTPVMAFKAWVHDSINKEAIDSIKVAVDGGREIQFSARALKEIQHANRAVDYRNSRDGFRGELTDPAAHCDDEKLEECSDHIEDLKSNITMLADRKSGKELRIWLGRSLHTLQDFYSHSNWVDERGMNRTTPNSDLGKYSLVTAQVDEACCQSTEWDLYEGAGMSKLTSGYFPLQFKKGLIPIAIQGLNIWSPPANKCAHGYSASPDSVPPLTGCVGINKDFEGRPNFSRARTVAVEASRIYINEIVTELIQQFPDANYRPVKKMLDVRGTLGFVIDDTGSMAPTIDGVKSSVTGIINSVKNNPDQSPDHYLLVRFGEYVSDPFVTDDPEALLASVNAIVASGGDDCPERANSAMLTAINAAEFGSKLYLFTDASAKDAGLTQHVIAAAKAKEIVSPNYILTGNCSADYPYSYSMASTERVRLSTPLAAASASTIEASFERIVQETGGQLTLLSNDADSVADYFSIIEPELTGDLEAVLIMAGMLPETPKTISIPVDASMTSLVISATMEIKGTISLNRPDGGPAIADSDGDATITQLPNGWVIHVSAPTPGRWLLSLSGNPDQVYSMTVMGNTPLRFERFEFVELKGQTLHESYFPIEGQPVLGAPAKVLADLSGPFASTEFMLGTENGTVINTIELLQGHSDASEEDFVGAIDLPDAPFRVYVSGVDDHGFDFLRAHPPVFNARTVAVSPLLYDSDGDLVAGKTCSAKFKVTNHAAVEATFDLSATDDQGFVQSISHDRVTLAAGESVDIDVVLDVPEATPADTNVVLTVVATSTTDSRDENSAALGWFSQAAAAPEPPPPTDTGGGGGGGGGCFIEGMMD